MEGRVENTWRTLSVINWVTWRKWKKLYDSIIHQFVRTITVTFTEILRKLSQGNPSVEVGGIKSKRGSQIWRFWTCRRLYLGNSARYTPCPKKTKQICFCQNFVKFPQISIIFGRKMGNDLSICEVYSLSTSPNLRHHLTVLNANVPNCYITPNVVICNKLLTT